ncbi:MAG: hypothetical protein OXF02_06065 [Simkaniaceae bacterium]|nr:hypothetical protein [Simkaniaceae bacterium]
MGSLSTLLLNIVQDEVLHARWLNTLSFLENCGAKKIAACEHPTLVREEMLKHAAEEFRHSLYLKRQIGRCSGFVCPDYSPPYILGGFASLRYLDRLDLLTSRFLVEQISSDKRKVREMAYLLVTYAIEVRARKLYPSYEQVLRGCGSRVFVKSIILEEEEHLREMEGGIAKMVSGVTYARRIRLFEEGLFRKWMQALERAVISWRNSTSIPKGKSFA